MTLQHIQFYLSIQTMCLKKIVNLSLFSLPKHPCCRAVSPPSVPPTFLKVENTVDPSFCSRIVSKSTALRGGELIQLLHCWKSYVTADANA